MIQPARNSMIKIDGKKLYNQFKKHGITQLRVCKEVGVNSGYFSNARNRGSLASMMVMLLESQYGIPRDTYVIPEVTETQVVEVVPKDDFFSEENQQKLYKLMYSAMYNAVKRALEE